jgi:ATP-dependent DNA helicase DinG
VIGVSDDLIEVLNQVVSALPGGGEARPGQRKMAQAIADAINEGRHAVVQAGTGTGKSLAYLVPALLSAKRVVVATATKALQDQLANKDLPFLQRTMARPFQFAVLKGRSNYVCVQRLREHSTTATLDLDDVSPQVRGEIRKLDEWATSSPTGDRAELDWEPLERSWSSVSVTSHECPGVNACPSGDRCFAEAARRVAAGADVVIVNLHLYGLHMASDQMLLPEHDVVVIDEAHQLEDTISATSGLEMTGGRLGALARLTKAILAEEQLVADVAAAGSRLAAELQPFAGQSLSRPLPEAVQAALALCRDRAGAALSALRAIAPSQPDADSRKQRGVKAASALIEELDIATQGIKQTVTWVEANGANPRLRIAPIDVAPVLRFGLWDQHPTVLTSATIPFAAAERLGIEAGSYESLDVGSPFDYAEQALLYCALHMPDPRSAEFGPAVVEELEALIGAAGGRTLALFTSWRAMQEAAEALKPRLSHRVLTQSDFPKPKLVAEFSDDEHSCLFATAGLFQGIDIPGRTLSLVTIDKIPFPRQDDPLLSARRDLAGSSAFRTVDLPRASTLLAQAAGRLIRSANDRGVVAVFDRRLGTAGYRWDIVNALPPMKRTRHRAEAEDFLRGLSE